jgi:hypothetical protein
VKSSFSPSGAARDGLCAVSGSNGRTPPNHAFHKKSKKGAATPKAEMDVIEKRLKDLVNEKERQR